MKSFKKELLDQSLHFFGGLTCVLVLSITFLKLWAAVLFVALFAYGREVLQRLDNGDPWYDCGKGCMLDLAFWALGILAGVALYLWLP